jgi:hypothetical protein
MWCYNARYDIIGLIKGNLVQISENNIYMVLTSDWRIL